MPGEVKIRYSSLERCVSRRDPYLGDGHLYWVTGWKFSKMIEQLTKEYSILIINCQNGTMGLLACWGLGCPHMIWHRSMPDAGSTSVLLSDMRYRCRHRSSLFGVHITRDLTSCQKSSFCTSRPSFVFHSFSYLNSYVSLLLGSAGKICKLFLKRKGNTENNFKELAIMLERNLLCNLNLLV